jgi:leucyl aminopeptidase (aminopeptidase T)
MHLALGQAYFNVYPGDGSKLTEQEWEALGYNDSTEHADLVTRGDGLEVTNLTDGRDDVIYKDGEFTV